MKYQVPSLYELIKSYQKLIAFSTSDRFSDKQQEEISNWLSIIWDKISLIIIDIDIDNG